MNDQFRYQYGGVISNRYEGYSIDCPQEEADQIAIEFERRLNEVEKIVASLSPTPEIKIIHPLDFRRIFRRQEKFPIVLEVEGQAFDPFDLPPDIAKEADRKNEEGERENKLQSELARWKARLAPIVPEPGWSTDNWEKWLTRDD